MKIHCISLGCPKNLTDTEAVLGILQKAGHKIIQDPGAADIIMINTCAFIESATEESIDTILEAAKYKKKGVCKHLIVIGCLPSRYGDKLRRFLPEVDAFVEAGGLENIGNAIKDCLSANALKQTIMSPSGHGAPTSCKKSILFSSQTTKLKATPKHYAYVKIADGCNNRCKYCTIPSIRGPYHSRPMEDVLKEVKLLAKMGTKEIIYVAQDTTYYGKDRYGKFMFAKLLKKTAKIRGIRWIRIMYTHPSHITPELLKTIKNESKICKYLDLPLQHICDKILKNMGRRYTRTKIESLIAKIRRFIPKIVLRTTFLVGFPGETKKDFVELLDFIQKVKFERLGVFKYSKEEGTPAKNMRGQVPERVKSFRQDALMKRQKMISKYLNRNLLNKVFEVLVDTGVTGGSLGRTYMDAPEIDGSVLIKSQKLKPGRLVKAAICDCTAYDLSARLVT